MRSVFMVFGVLFIIAGLFFACQGAGYIHWPPAQPGQFTMVDNSRWITYGLAIAFFGMVVVFVSRRR
jgi:hypothetical protein